MLSMLVHFSSAQLAQSQAVAPPALTPCYYVRTEDTSQFIVTNSHVLTPIPMGIPWDPWDPSLPHSHAHLYCERFHRFARRQPKAQLQFSSCDGNEDFSIVHNYDYDATVMWLWCDCDRTCQSPSDVIILSYFYLLTSISYVIQVP